MKVARRPRSWLVLGLALFVASCSDGAPDRGKKIFSGSIMGTTYRVTIVGPPDVINKNNLLTGVLSAMQAVDQRMSTYKKTSELSRFNSVRTTDWVEISEALATVIEESIRVSELSGGAFDVTVGPLVDLWGFGPPGRVSVPPSGKDIETARARTGYRYLRLRRSPPAMKKDRPDLRVDLSAVAKGYAVDQVCEFLERQGIDDYLVDIGGDLRAKGRNDRGTQWTIAVEKPVPEERAIQRVVAVSGLALATSGDYRNYFEKDGKRYSHTIDPRTGSPIVHRLASVSVASQPAMYADALATAIMVLGPEAGMDLARKLDLAIFMIIRDGAGFSEKYTARFRDLFVDKGLRR